LRIGVGWGVGAMLVDGSVGGRKVESDQELVFESLG
jgi:hypothetical protein